MAKKRRVEQEPRAMTKRQLSRHQQAERRQRITRWAGIGIIAVVIIIVLVGVIIGEILPNHKTVLKVNDREFNYKYYEQSMQIFADQYGSSVISSLGEEMLNYISDNEILKLAAAELGFTVSDGEVKDRIKELGMDRNQASMDLVRADLLREKLKSEHIDPQVPLTDKQVQFDAMLLENDARVQELRDEVAEAVDFTELARENGLDYNSRNEPFGVYDWHPREIADRLLPYSVPLDYAFAAEAGDVSGPLPDAEVSKKLGYWLLRVNELTIQEGNEEEGVPETVSADVSGILLGSLEQAEEIRQRLEDGEELAVLAEEYSGHAGSAGNGGELGVLNKPLTEDSFALSETTDAYIFSEETPQDVWSEPLKDDNFYTEGGSWLVRVIGVEEDRELSEEDRETLISVEFSEWLNEATEDTGTYVVEKSLTSEQIQTAIEAVT